MAAFTEQWTELAEVDEAIDDWISIRTSSIGNRGYQPTMQGERTIAYRRHFTPGVAIFCGIITFPIGILFWLFWKRDEVFTVHFEAAGEETRVTAKGEAKDAVRWGIVRAAADEAEWAQAA